MWPSCPVPPPIHPSIELSIQPSSELVVGCRVTLSSLSCCDCLVHYTVSILQKQKKKKRESGPFSFNQPFPLKDSIKKLFPQIWIRKCINNQIDQAILKIEFRKGITWLVFEFHRNIIIIFWARTHREIGKFNNFSSFIHVLETLILFQVIIDNERTINQSVKKDECHLIAILFYFYKCIVFFTARWGKLP